MTDVERVIRSGSPFSGRERAIVLILTIGLIAAITKPWGVDPGRTSAASTPATSAGPSPSPVELAGHAYNPSLYGPFEPAPDWSIWPAGYFVSVRYVTRQSVERTPSRPAAPPSVAASPLPLGPSPGPGHSTAITGPDWPAEVVVGPGDHLLWLGVDTPLGWTIRDAVLRRFGDDGSLTNMPITRLPSDWDDHFAVLGIPLAANPERLTDWPPGRYSLAITVDPGQITRTIRITIMTATDPVPVPGVTTVP